MNRSRFGDPILEYIPKDIRQEIETLAHAHPTWADYQNRWGLFLLVEERTDEALDVFNRCLDLNPGYGWAAINRIGALALAGQGGEAAEALVNAPEPAPGIKSFVSAFLALVDSDPTRGLEDLADLPAGLRDRPDVERLRAALHHTEDRSKGNAAWKSLKGRYEDIPTGWVVPWDEDGSVEPRLVTFIPGMYQLFLELSNLAARRGSIRAAAGLADLLRLFWWDEAVHLTQHGFLANLEGKIDLAVELYDRAVQCDPESPRAHIALAYHWSSMGEVEEARHSLVDAMKLAPRYADLHYQMGLIQRASDETSEAVESFQRALAINPRYIMARMQEAAALFSLGDWQASCSAYRKVVDAGVESSDIYMQLGQAYTEIDLLDEAEEAFAKAAELVPDEPPRKRTA
jgi:tetratricopeptide (TPR) repeat protein